jgi:hypothetical protein
LETNFGKMAFQELNAHWWYQFGKRHLWLGGEKHFWLRNSMIREVGRASFSYNYTLALAFTWGKPQLW